MEIVPLTSSHGNTLVAPFQKSFSEACPSLIHMPVDVFIEICSHLPHYDLLNLMCVCRRFYYWLNSTTSYTTQDIWRTSRLKFDKYMKLDPPEGMDEISFIRLSMIEKKCQICKSDHDIPKIYWAFRVRLCIKCFKKRVTIAPDKIPEWAKDPIDITLVLPHEYLSISRNVTKCVYWTSELTSTLQECLFIPTEELGDWIFNKQITAKNKIEDATKRIKNDQIRLDWLLKEKKDLLDKTVKTLENIKDIKGKKIYLKNYIISQPTYQKALSTLKTPFMDTDPWPNLYKKLKNDLAIKRHRKLIIRRILQLLTSYRKLSDSKGEIFLNDPVLDCLEWCPTFIKPPEKLKDVDDVVLRIRDEAREYLKKRLHKRRGPFSTIEGCNKLLKTCNKTHVPLFKCKLCWGSGRKSYSYAGVNRHLMCQSAHNLYYSDIDDSMIEIDREKVRKLISTWLNNKVLLKTS
ncbi:hypothetical protein C1645_805779 [Glomus cerebriforme]|uniref:F-box domain-containing protein n=1 Tax=Glomus cerebriforme TaxID=658196 RepID=A0A397T286_9GLOM|nr:hypothetical protein C1645_805779 [Glomus cerebriforme]